MSNLSDFLGGGGGGAFTAESISIGQFIPVGTTADVTISCPTGKRLRLTRLVTATTSPQSGVTVTVGSNTLISNQELEDYLGRGISANFFVGPGGEGTSHDFILGGTDEDIVFSFSSATAYGISYVYQVGELK